MSNDFWVNVPGLADSAGGFADTSGDIRKLLEDFATESADPRIYGTTPDGHSFTENFTPNARAFADSMDGFHRTLAAIGDAISAMAADFQRTEEQATADTAPLAAPNGGVAPRAPRLTGAPSAQVPDTPSVPVVGGDPVSGAVGEGELGGVAPSAAVPAAPAAQLVPGAPSVGVGGVLPGTTVPVGTTVPRMVAGGRGPVVDSRLATGTDGDVES